MNLKKDQYYYISRHFSLPAGVYNEPDELRFFSKVLVMEGFNCFVMRAMRMCVLERLFPEICTLYFTLI